MLSMVEAQRLQPECAVGKKHQKMQMTLSRQRKVEAEGMKRRANVTSARNGAPSTVRPSAPVTIAGTGERIVVCRFARLEARWWWWWWCDAIGLGASCEIVKVSVTKAL